MPDPSVTCDDAAWGDVVEVVVACPVKAEDEHEDATNIPINVAAREATALMLVVIVPAARLARARLANGKGPALAASTGPMRKRRQGGAGTGLLSACPPGWCPSAVHPNPTVRLVLRGPSG